MSDSARSTPSYRALQHLGDDEVMAHLQAGSDDALAILFDRYHRLVYSIGLRILRDQGEAEDVTQVVFLDIFRAAAQFDRSRGNTRVWLLQYAYHRALSRKRYLNVRNFYRPQEDENAAAAVTTADHPPFRLGSFELKDLLEKGLASLSAPQRDVITQATFTGLSMKEIAERTGQTFVNVRHHYYRGLRKLRVFVERQSDLDTAVGDD